jgi:hypothetical protein
VWDVDVETELNPALLLARALTQKEVVGKVWLHGRTADGGEDRIQFVKKAEVHQTALVRAAADTITARLRADVAACGLMERIQRAGLISITARAIAGGIATRTCALK